MRRLAIAAWIGLCCWGAGALAAEPEGEFLGKSHQQWLAELKSESASQRHLAAWALAQPTMKVGMSLLDAADHEDPVVRFWAVTGLIRRAEAMGPMPNWLIEEKVSAILTDKSTTTRLVAAEGLARLWNHPGAYTVLIDALANPQEAVRIQAIDSLDRLGAKCAPLKEHIEKATSGDTSEYVKRISTRLLARLSQKAP